MFSTKLKNNRYLINCVMVTDHPRVVEFVIDTGAFYTCCNYAVVDPFLTEDLMSGCEIKTLGGLVVGDTMKFYRYPVKQLSVGNVNLGSQDVWVS